MLKEGGSRLLVCHRAAFRDRIWRLTATVGAPPDPRSSSSPTTSMRRATSGASGWPNLDFT